MRIPLRDNGIYLAMVVLVALLAIILADRYAAEVADRPIVVRIAHDGVKALDPKVDSLGRPSQSDDAEEALDTRRSDAQVALMANPELVAEPAMLLDELVKLRSTEGDSLALLNDLGVVALRAQETDEAILYLQAATAMREDYARAWYNLGVAFNRARRFVDAAAAFRRALEHNPAYQEAALQVAHASRRTGDLESARAAYARAAAISNSDGRARALYFEGTVLLDSGNTAEAAGVFRRSIEYNPRDADTWLALGRTLLPNPSERDSALAAFENAVALAPRNLAFRLDVVGALSAAGFRDVALDYLQKFVQIDPASSDARREMARLFAAQGDLAAAEIQYKWLVENTDDKSEVIRYRAERAIIRDELDEAVRLLSELVGAGTGDDINTRLRLGLILRRAGRDEEALAAYNALIEVDPDNVDGLSGGAGAALNLGRLDQAQRLLDRALEIRPDDRDVWFMFGRLREATGDLAAAAEAYEHCLTLDGGYRRAALNLAIVKRRLGAPGESLALYQSILADSPRYTLARYNLAVVQSLMGDDAAAAASYELVLEQDPENDKARLNLAVIRRAEGRLDEAEALLRDALARDAANVSARFNLSLLLGATARPQEQELELKRILQLDTTFAKAWRSLGRLLQNRGELDAAAERYLRALELDPDATITPILELANTLRGAREPALARRLYEAILATDPDHGETVVGLASLEREDGHVAQAIALLERFLDRDPGNESALFELAVATESAKDPRAAISQMERLVEINPQRVDGWRMLAQWRRAAGDSSGAAAALRTAISLAPDDDGLIGMAMELSQGDQNAH